MDLFRTHCAAVGDSVAAEGLFEPSKIFIGEGKNYCVSLYWCPENRLTGTFCNKTN